MRTILYAILFIVVCISAILGGFYSYLGAQGTLRCREDSIARAQFLWEPVFLYKHQYLTQDDLESVPENFADKYEESVRAGYVLANQGDWDKIVMLCQSLVLLAAGVAGLISLKRPQVYD